MAIKHIILSNFRDNKDSRLFEVLRYSATTAELELVNFQQEEALLIDELILNLEQLTIAQYNLYLLISVDSVKARYSKIDVNNLWMALKRHNLDNKLIVVAEGVHSIANDVLIDVFAEVYPSLMLADHFWFEDELSYYNFISESAHSAKGNFELAKRTNSAKYFDLNCGIEQVFNQNLQVDVTVQPAAVVPSVVSSANEPQVDLNLWYAEPEILQAVRGMLPAQGLQLSGVGYAGMVLNANGSVYVVKKRTISVCDHLVLGQSTVTNQSDFDFFKLAINRILSQKTNAARHTILFPINWHQKNHFCLGMLTFSLERSDDVAVINSSGILLSVLDTMYEVGCIDEVEQLLRPLITKFCKKNITPEITTMARYVTPQPDTSACGVLVAESMFRFICDGGMVDSQTPVTIEQVLELRRKHLKALNSKKFTELQTNRAALQHTKPKTVAVPVQAFNASAMAKHLETYLGSIDKPLVLQFQTYALVFIICDLNTLKVGADKSTKPLIALKLTQAQNNFKTLNLGEEFAFALLDVASFTGDELEFKSSEVMEQGRIHSNKLKDWFGQTHKDSSSSVELALRSDAYGNFLDNIFRQARDEDYDYEWTSEGRANLIRVLEILFSLHLVKVHEEIKINKLKPVPKFEHQLDHPLFTFDFMQNAKSFFKIFNEELGYSYAGTVNEDNQAHGVGQERIGEDYSYVGNFYNNSKAGDGVERHRIKGSNLYNEFNGKSDLNGTYFKGSISCFLGGPSPESEHLHFAGHINEGKIQGFGLLSVVSSAGEVVLQIGVEVTPGESIRQVPFAYNEVHQDIAKFHMLKSASNFINEWRLNMDVNFESILSSIRGSIMPSPKDIVMTSLSLDDPIAYTTPPPSGYYPSRSKPTLHVDTNLDGDGVESEIKSIDSASSTFGVAKQSSPPTSPRLKRE